MVPPHCFRLEAEPNFGEETRSFRPQRGPEPEALPTGTPKPGLQSLHGVDTVIP